MEENQAVEGQQEVPGKVDVSETCLECGKVFDNESAMKNKNALRGHRMTHKRKIGQRKEPKDMAAAGQPKGIPENETIEQKIKRIRSGRVPMGLPDRKWNCPENDGYQYRVFNDNWMAKPGNIQAAQAAGYELVHSQDEKQKEKVVGTNDNGTAITGFLMRIPKVIFDEDQAAKQKINDRIDQQIRAGKFQEGRGDGRYIPAGGIKISSDTHAPE